MAKRPIIKIDEEKCTGCGLCIPACAEGALAIVDGKAKIVKEIYCDGLGACLGECPEGALTIEEREAPEYDEHATLEYLRETGRTAPHAAGSPVPDEVVGEHDPLAERLACGCPGSQVRSLEPAAPKSGEGSGPISSRLRQWPVQLVLVPPSAPYLRGADLLITADCVPFAYADYHRDFLDGKAVVVGCPKLDDNEYYRQKLTEIFRTAGIKSVTVLKMEVPCCSGIATAAADAIEASGRQIPMSVITIGIDGTILHGGQQADRAAG